MKKLMEQLEGLLEIGGTKKDIACLIISAMSLLLSIFAPDLLPFDAAWISIVLCGIPIILEAIIGLVTAFDIKADVLVSIALIASICIKEDFAAGEVAFIMQLGALLEDITVAKARAGIERLVKLTPNTARVIIDGEEKIISAKDVKKDDILRVLAGETISSDGVIISGKTSVDQSIMTGESLPVDKMPGDEVYGGTINCYGTFEMKATKVGEDSTIQRLIRLVESADASKAKIVGIADKWATWIVVIALSAAAITWSITGEIIRAVTILVVFCPCALVLATPTAIMAAIGNASKHGFLVREGDALERLATINTVAFDKTGTLTVGVPKVSAVIPHDNITEEELFEITACAELLSEHPLGKAIITSFKEKYDTLISKPEEFELAVGRGIYAKVNNKKVIAGNLKHLSENDIDVPKKAIDIAEKYLLEGATVIYTCVDGVYIGLLALADTLREDSVKTINNISSLNIKTALLTGDNKNAANSIAKALSISEVRANCLPEDKLSIIKEKQDNNEAVCMIGDGVNDAPALKLATVGIAMGGIGSDIAADAADIVLANDEIHELPHLLALSKRMMKTIKFNLSFSMLLNFLAIVLAIIGALGPVVGALVHNAGSVAVIINSAFLLKWSKK